MHAAAIRTGDVEVTQRTGLCPAPGTRAGLMSTMFDGGLIVLLKLWMAFIRRVLPGDDSLMWDIGNSRKSSKLDLLAAEFHIFELESGKVGGFNAR